MVCEKDCASYQVGVGIDLQLKHEKPLSCLNCEGLVHSHDFQKFIETGVKNKKRFYFQYKNFVVFADSKEHIVLKIKKMLQQFGLQEHVVFEMIGDYFFEKSDIPTAYQYYHQSEMLQPSASLSLKLGEVYYYLGNYGEALTHFIRAKQLNVQAYLFIGHCHSKLGNKELALEHFKRAAVLEPENSKVNEALATFYYKRFEEDSTYAQDSLHYFNFFIDKQWSDRLNKLASFRGGYDYDSKDFYYIQYANLNYSVGNYEGAISSLEKYIKLFPFTSKKDVHRSIQNRLLMEFVPEDLEELKKSYRNQMANFFQKVFTKLYELLAKSYFQKEEYSKARQMVQYAMAFDYANPELSMLAQSIKEKSMMETMGVSLESLMNWKQQMDEEMENLKYHIKNNDDKLTRIEEENRERDRVLAEHERLLRKLDAKVEGIEHDLHILKGYVDYRLNVQDELLAYHTSRLPGWKDRHEYIREAVSSNLFEKLRDFDEVTDKQLKERFQLVEDIQDMGKVLDEWGTGEWLYHHFEEVFNSKEKLEGFDASFIVVSYFKAVEILLAKKLGFLSQGERLLKKEWDKKERKNRIVPMYSQVIGEETFFTTQTLGSYNTFIWLYSQYQQYKPEKDPLKTEHRDSRSEITSKCHQFVQEHRNKCSHKSLLSIDEVKEVRTQFTSLMMELWRAFRQVK